MNSIRFQILFSCMLLLSLACTKKEYYDKMESATDGGMVYLQQAANGVNGFYKIATFPADDKDLQQFISVNYGSMGFNANDINIKLAVDDAAFTKANQERVTQGLAPYEHFPNNAYSIDKLDITIPAGKAGSSVTGFATITYNPSKFNISKVYLLAISISNADGYNINEKFKTVYFYVAPPAVDSYIKMTQKSRWKAKAQSLVSLGITPNPNDNWAGLVTTAEEPWEASDSYANGGGDKNGYASAAVDGSKSTFWHTPWGFEWYDIVQSTNPTLPIYTTIDIDTTMYIGQIGITTRQGSTRGCTLFDLDVSADGTNWTKVLANQVMDAANMKEQVFKFQFGKYRYFRWTALEGNKGANDYTFVSEFDLYETKLK